MTLLHEGDEIRGTYVVERFLGEGAFAEVYRVQHQILGRLAMKVLHASAVAGGDYKSLLSEAVMLANMGHPNIVRVFEANTLDLGREVRVFFTMEYVAGGSLERYWRSYGPRFVPVAETIDILTQACRGLAVAHRETPPVVHRDIKPQNILVGYDTHGLRVRICDFGLAKRVNPLSLMATAYGTVAFKAPETFADPMADSCAGDVWALGTTAYLLLTDRFPFSHQNESGGSSRRDFDTPVLAPSRFNLDVDECLDAIVLRALAPDPADRYPDAGAMLDALDDCRHLSQATAKGLDWPTTTKAPIRADAEPSFDEAGAEAMAQHARTLAVAHQLSAAADVLEEACNKAPGLRARYANLIRLWRNGIVG